MFRIKYAREVVLKLLYQIDILQLKDFSEETIINNNLNFFRDLTDEEQKFILKIMKNVSKNKETTDDLITKNLIGWRLERLTPIDRNLLRMGISEADFNDQKAVIIDDILRIAKKYGSKDSYKILNAILDKVI